jgi:hypothetical protein
VRNAGYVISVDERRVTLFDAERRTFHCVERGLGCHFWIDDGIRGNHRFTSYPDVKDVIHFLTSDFITDVTDATKIVGDIGEQVHKALTGLAEEKALPATKIKKQRGRAKKKPIKSVHEGRMKLCLLCGNELTQDDLPEYCSVCASIHEIEDC